MAYIILIIGILIFVGIPTSIIYNQKHIPRKLIKKINGDVYVRLFTYNNYNVYITKERYLECKNSYYYSIAKVTDYILGEFIKRKLRAKSNDILATLVFDGNTMNVSLGTWYINK